ncbi:MAG: alpha/beta hydrolase [Anaerolineales bacterium]
MSRMLMLLGAVLALLVIAAPTSAQTDFTPTFEATDCRFPTPTSGDLTCGDLIVPEDWDAPEGKTIRLHVAIFAARAADPAPEPILFLQGGPGGSGLDLLEPGYPLIFGPFNADYDFMVLEQRGTRYSQPDLICDELNDLSFEYLDDDLAAETLRAEQWDALRACRERLVAEGVDLAEYHSDNNARDIAALAAALDVPGFNLYGVSYGSRLALTVMRDHPEVVRSAVLDAPFPPQVDIYADFRQNTFGALEDVFVACAADDVCNAAYPDLETTFRETYDALNADPITTQARLPSTGETYDILIDGNGFLGFLFLALYQSSFIPEVPSIIAAASQGNVEQIAFLSMLFFDQSLDSSIGMLLSVQCREEVPYNDAARGQEVEQRYADFNEFFVGQLDSATNIAQTCAIWDVPAAPRIENEPVVSDVPALVMAGTFDPATPPRWGRLMAETLSNGTFLEVPNAGHGVIDLACPREIVLEFYDDPTVAPSGDCLQDIGDLAFSAPQSREVVLVPYEDALTGLQSVRPEGWQELGPGTFGRSSIGEVALAQVAARGADEQLLLSVISSQLLGDEPLEATDTYTTPDGNTWTLYEFSVQGLAIRLATRPDESGAILVLLQAPFSEISALSDSILFPVLDVAVFLP